MYQNFTQDQLQVVDSQRRELSEFESLPGLGPGADSGQVPGPGGLAEASKGTDQVAGEA